MRHVGQLLLFPFRLAYQLLYTVLWYLTDSRFTWNLCFLVFIFSIAFGWTINMHALSNRWFTAMAVLYVTRYVLVYVVGAVVRRLPRPGRLWTFGPKREKPARVRVVMPERYVPSTPGEIIHRLPDHLKDLLTGPH